MDEDALKKILNLVDATNKLAHWRLRLSGFEFDVVHRDGIENQAPDALSRLETGWTDTTELDNDLPEMQV